ncbi:hypothetical protein LTS16_006058 [Friedmanniomyces endolithicus]|nr:hypothetical protein LTR94_022056 [Friedmanniomyces endolithicus]KAK0769510.1 hypothetical protein LTR59_016978 [Friedmanniomyces endolithicus]KAK0774593.1 hypothetical protein LTR38_016147 [Friedmanniomyces endolithicus]KAK0802750.1 hypothetical protein LTR75_008146 [Friedmanniomyces endolithicus]KAK0831871.1 hypothetical protein LTR03_015376 [Friedmanniomyces endolithicus]
MLMLAQHLRLNKQPTSHQYPKQTPKSSPEMLDPVRASTLHVLLTPIMAAQIYTVEQIKNILNFTLGDGAKKAIGSKIDCFMKPLKQEAHRIGLRKEYAQLLAPGTAAWPNTFNSATLSRSPHCSTASTLL